METLGYKNALHPIRVMENEATLSGMSVSGDKHGM